MRIVTASACLAALTVGLPAAQAATPPISFDAPRVFQAFPVGQEEVGITTVSGDFNGDGKQDLAVMNFDTLTILLGNGDGTFQPPLGSYSAGWQFFGMVAGDFNGDGKLDLAVGEEFSNVYPGTYGYQIFLGNGDGTFTLLLPVDGAVQPSIAADFNGDGKLDLALVNGSAVQILFGNGNGTFQPPVG